MGLFHNIIADSIVQIGLHILENEVHVFIVFSSYGFMQFDDVCMFSLLQNFYLSESSLCISGVLKSIEYFFKSKYFLS